MTAMKERVHVILAAGGTGTRMGAGLNKIFLEAGGKSILLRSMQLFEGIIDRMVIVCRPEDEQQISRIVSLSGVSYQVSLAHGGESRQHSVLNGLKSLGADPDDIVLVHDAARCLTPVEVTLDILESCRSKGSGVAAVPAVNTMKYADGDKYVLHTADRTNLYEIQTPQGFRFAQLYDSYIKAEKDGFIATDDASVAEHAGIRVHLVRGSKKNIKVTEKEDLVMINALLQQDTPPFRIGMGYDVHRLTEGRKLILCGIEIPHTLGLLGHSDADVALHALMDAMFGAAALGDIGRHFPDTSDEYKGISSVLLLKEAIRKVREAGYEFVNADITIAAQKPRISPYIPEMIRKVSETLSCDAVQVNIKATTTEKLGFEGREEGISAQAVCLLRRF
jgi:2-C-methyl-D-erythritol 4-phosphate cytidylyltransferase/2-C-methyl-D-erythritol 2,4-cyclodiphosphate synthase